MSWVQVACETEKYPGVPEGCLILGDNGEADLSPWLGQVQCVYMDPPYMTGERFIYHCRIGEDGWETGRRAIDLPAYSDRYERDAYLSMLRTALLRAKALLNERGSLFLHMDSRMAHYGRLLCDEIFGEKNFVNEIIWAYQSGGRSTKHFSRKHDTILFYRVSRLQYFDITAVPLPRAGNRQNHMRREVDAEGRAFRSIRSGGKLYTYYDDDPVYPGDVWSDVSHLQQKDPQRTGFDTQKPAALLERIIRSATREGDTVADLFCGSGTAMSVAASLGRRFLGVDSSRAAIQVSARRLAGSGLHIRMESGCEGAALDMRVMSGIGLDDYHLVSYSAPGIPEGITGTDAVERLAVGFIDQGRFSACAFWGRAKHTPAVPQVLQLPQISGTPAVLVGDILGRSSCWIWRED